MISPGDIVTLQSGGPEMTVQQVYGLRKNKHAVCIFWRTNKSSYHSGDKVFGTNENNYEEKVYTYTAALKKVS